MILLNIYLSLKFSRSFFSFSQTQQTWMLFHYFYHFIFYTVSRTIKISPKSFLFPIKPEKNLVNKLVATAELFRISYSLPPIKFTCLLVSPLMYCKQIPKHLQLSISIFILVSQIWYYKSSVWRAVVSIVGVKGNLYDVRVMIYLSLCLCYAAQHITKSC